MRNAFVLLLGLGAAAGVAVVVVACDTTFADAPVGDCNPLIECGCPSETGPCPAPDAGRDAADDGSVESDAPGSTDEDASSDATDGGTYSDASDGSPED